MSPWSCQPLHPSSVCSKQAAYSLGSLFLCSKAIPVGWNLSLKEPYKDSYKIIVAFTWLNLLQLTPLCLLSALKFTVCMLLVGTVSFCGFPGLSPSLFPVLCRSILFCSAASFKFRFFSLSNFRPVSLYPILDVKLCHRDVLIIACCWFLFKTYSGKKWIGFFWLQVTEVIQSVSHVLQSLLNFILYKSDWTLVLPFCSKDLFLSSPVLTSFWQSKPRPLTNLWTEDNHILHPWVYGVLSASETDLKRKRP